MIDKMIDRYEENGRIMYEVESFYLTAVLST